MYKTNLVTSRAERRKLPCLSILSVSWRPKQRTHEQHRILVYNISFIVNISAQQFLVIVVGGL